MASPILLHSHFEPSLTEAEMEMLQTPWNRTGQGYECAQKLRRSSYVQLTDFQPHLSKILPLYEKKRHCQGQTLQDLQRKSCCYVQRSGYHQGFEGK